MAFFLYVSQLKEKNIAWYRIDPQNGDLTIEGQVDTPGEPGAQGVAPGGQYLYVAMRSTGSLCSFALDPVSGRPDLLHCLDSGLEDPAYMATDHSGRYLFTPYYASGKVTVCPIDEDGAARGPFTARIDTAPHAHGIAVDQQNRYVFVPHTCPGNAVWQLVFDKGHLRSNTPVRVDFDRDIGPRHLHLHPDNGCAYSCNEQDNSVTAYHFDAQRGTLAPFQTLTTVPAGHNGGACARMEIHPSGQLLYVANRGHNSLAAFGLDRKDGSLSPVGFFPTASNPRSFHFGPQGRFLYAAGESTQRLDAYRVDTGSGVLEPLRSYRTGKVPWWVQGVEVG
jgi:6-phosphogluconolactonase